MNTTLPVNPALSIDFFSTPNENRSDEEIAIWWDHPFAQLQEDGTMRVLCLDGGAWDRPTWYGDASNIEEATTLANQKLTAWRATRARPTVLLDDGSVKVVRMPQKPNDEVEVLGTFDDTAAAQKYISETVGK